MYPNKLIDVISAQSGAVELPLSKKRGRLGDGPCMLGWGQQLRKTNLFHSASITFKNLPLFSYQPNSLKRHHVRTTRNDNQFRLHVCNDAIT